MGFIYKISNNINNKIYIGKTCSSIHKRWQKHCCAYTEYNWHIYRAMRKYGIENFKIEEIEKCKDEDLNSREKYWISYYNSYHNGYNSTEGGDGRTQVNRSMIKNMWKEGYSSKQIADKMNIWSSTVINILKELNIYDEEEIKYRKMVDIANTQSDKKIIQYDENGIIVKKYNSVLEAARTIKGKSSSIWTGITSGGSRYGYFWGKEGEKLPNFHKITRPKTRKIYQYDKNLNFIQEFSNAAEAAKAIKASGSSNILKACKGERKTAYGYIWSYERS